MIKTTRNGVYMGFILILLLTRLNLLLRRVIDILHEIVVVVVVVEVLIQVKKLVKLKYEIDL